MNAKFDKLNKIMKNIHEILLKQSENPVNDNEIITINKVDELIRCYATKTLLFNIGNIVKLPSASPRSDDILQSIDSSSFIISEEEFTMPLDTPDKLEWVSNDDVTDCMCCKKSTFTMFNRRHHCRRCGRVVCGACSSKRLKLPSYDDLNVRVCINCYDQTISAATVPNDVSLCNSTRCSSVSELASEWRLSSDSNHNHTVRGEFSYEHAPSVSLCLATLNLHSDNTDCPDFLLSQCETIVKHLRPQISGSLNPEVDHSLLIRMLRSLALAAKVKYSHLLQAQYVQTPTPSPDDDQERSFPKFEKSDSTKPSPSPSPLTTATSVASRSYIGLSNCDAMLCHADLMNLLVEHGCAGLIPTSSLSGHGLRRLRDSLVRGERWDVALELSLKAGLGRGGVLAAWGKACLRAGTFNTARDKFRYCLKPISDSGSQTPTTPPFEEFGSSSSSPARALASELARADTRLSIGSDLSVYIYRPNKNPPLLNEIINILESTSYPLNPAVLKNAEKIKISNSNLSQNKPSKSSKNFGLPKEPALNVLHILSNLKNISSGNYEPNYKPDVVKSEFKYIKRPKSVVKPAQQELNVNQLNNKPLETFFFDECMYYLTTYGSHESILAFYLRHGDLKQVLDYVVANPVENDIFTDVVYMSCLRHGHIDLLHGEMFGMDNSLGIWKDQLTHICRYLEKSNLLNTLYQLQIFMHDFVRASMTCIRFYTSKCKSYIDLLHNVEYLNTAEKHLHQELEQSHWMSLTVPIPKPEDNVNETQTKRFSVSSVDSGLIMKMDSKELNKHIHTICRQREITKFLATCEIGEKEITMILLKIFPRSSQSGPATNSNIPTLFGPQIERIQLSVLAIVCGQNVEEGFGLSFRIIQDYQLNASRIYCLASRFLCTSSSYAQIEKLCQCIQTSGAPKLSATAICDEVAELAIKKMVANWNEPGAAVDNAVAENLIKIVQDVGKKISCYIESRQLKSAYLLAVKHNRMADVRRISREAESLGQTHIKNICAKRLSQQ